MTAPLCIGVRRQKPVVRCQKPVKRFHSSRRPVMGYRVIDGVRWCWFCSKRCAGRAQGRKMAKDPRFAFYAEKVNAARQRACQVERQAVYAEDIHGLMQRGVPRHLALAILDRVYSIGFKAGYTRAFNRHGRKVAA